MLITEIDTWMTRCTDIDTWMTLNRLKLNKEKTELLVLHSRYRSPPAFASLKIGSEVILSSHSARNVGVIFDNTMTMMPHINSTCKSAFYHLRNIARIRKFISLKTTETLVHAFVNSKLGYCNSLAYGLPKYLLQYVQVFKFSMVKTPLRVLLLVYGNTTT